MRDQSTGFDAAARLMRLATYASVATATVLAILKLVAWVMTDSVSLLSTLIDSLLDVAASLVTLFAIRQALTPADNEHRFGHGKAEPLASLGSLLSRGKDQIGTAPWMLWSPAMLMLVTLLALNFLGDGLRDALDPKDR